MPGVPKATKPGRHKDGSSRRRRRTRPLLALTAVALLAWGGYGLANRYHATHGPTPKVAAQADPDAAAHPDETPPDPACSDFPVGDKQPRRITVKQIDVKACIQKVGVDKTNHIVAPSNLHVAGWYTDSHIPGSSGLSIIDGHDKGTYADGVFKNLYKIKSGAKISVELGNGHRVLYTVRKVTQYPVEKSMTSLYADARPYDTALALITCHGPWDTKKGTVVDRIVVIATPIGGSSSQA